MKLHVSCMLDAVHSSLMCLGRNECSVGKADPTCVELPGGLGIGS